MSMPIDDNTVWPPQPLTLSGEHVRLEPLRIEHAPALEQAAADGELWRLWYTSVPAPGHAREYVEAALSDQAQGRSLPFAVLDGEGRVVGSTRYCHIESAHRRLEIGYTWYAQRVQRSALNTQAKRLLLAHAFEALDAVAVEFRTHWFNHRSRAAIERLGAKQDGVLRNHMILPDGTLRDTVVYSIIASEWPAVRTHLDHRLQGRQS
jgi:RimJ/RimL family protein N-acetyltransferase